MKRMTDGEAKALLNILASDRLPVVSTERRQAVILHALQAIEDRAALVKGAEEWGHGPTYTPMLLARDHMNGNG
jgi:hypothetical protein